MSDDLLIETAESLCESLQDGDDDYAEERQIIRDLIAEISRLQTQVENCHAAKNLHVRRSEKLQEQLAAKDALNNDLMANCNQLRDRCWKAESELARWQKIAIEATAMQLDDLPNADRCKHRTGYEYCDLLDDICDGFPHMLEICPIKEHWMSIATKELNLQVTQPDDDKLTVAYMLGGKKADERLEVLQGYVARLEAAYIADSMQSEELAQAALNKIREDRP
jgi:hypothetical protein